jgi:hypothetical protein
VRPILAAVSPHLMQTKQHQHNAVPKRGILIPSTTCEKRIWLVIDCGFEKIRHVQRIC